MASEGEGDDAGEGSPRGPGGARPEGTGTIARRLVGDLLAALPPEAVPELEVVTGAEPGQRLALAERGRSYVVGRAPGCALPLAVDEISREHALFVRTAAGVIVRDAGSKNGVRVAGERIDGERRLRHGDLVELGPVTLRLRDPVDRYLDEIAAAAASSSAATGPGPEPGAVELAERATDVASARQGTAGLAPPTHAGALMTAVAVTVLLGAAVAAIALLAG